MADRFVVINSYDYNGYRIEQFRHVEDKPSEVRHYRIGRGSPQTTSEIFSRISDAEDWVKACIARTQANPAGAPAQPQATTTEMTEPEPNPTAAELIYDAHDEIQRTIADRLNDWLGSQESISLWVDGDTVYLGERDEEGQATHASPNILAHSPALVLCLRTAKDITDTLRAHGNDSQLNVLMHELDARMYAAYDTLSDYDSAYRDAMEVRSDLDLLADFEASLSGSNEDVTATMRRKIDEIRAIASTREATLADARARAETTTRTITQAAVDTMRSIDTVASQQAARERDLRIVGHAKTILDKYANEQYANIPRG